MPPAMTTARGDVGELPRALASICFTLSYVTKYMPVPMVSRTIMISQAPSGLGSGGATDASASESQNTGPSSLDVARGSGLF